jgi:hypothetical protein
MTYAYEYANKWMHMTFYIGRPETPHIHHLVNFPPSIKELNQKY